MPLQSKGFTAWISIDDTELDAYNVETTNDGGKVTGWIASETGKASLAYYYNSDLALTTDLELCCQLDQTPRRAVDYDVRPSESRRHRLLREADETRQKYGLQQVRILDIAYHCQAFPVW